MRDHSRFRPSAGLRGEGAGAVSVCAPDTDIPAPQPAPGAARRALRRLPSPRLPRHQHLHAPDRRVPERGNVPTVENLDPTAQLIIDGTLLQCWHWAGHPELYSDKHQTTGLNVQVACTLSRTLARNLHPQDGRVHNAQALRRRGLLDVLATDLPNGTSPQHVGDKGYIGLGMITPEKKTLEPAAPPRRQDLRPTTPPSTRSATRSKELSPTSKHGESCTPATEDH